MVVEKLQQKTTHLAKAVEPDRFQFWKTPSFDAEPFLDDANREFSNFFFLSRRSLTPSLGQLLGSQ